MNATIHVVLVVVLLLAIALSAPSSRCKKRRAEIARIQRKKKDCLDLAENNRILLANCRASAEALRDHVSPPEFVGLERVLSIAKGEHERAGKMLEASLESEKRFLSERPAAEALKGFNNFELTLTELEIAQRVIAAAQEKNANLEQLEASASFALVGLTRSIERADAAVAEEKENGFKLPSIEAALARAQGMLTLLREKEFTAHEFGKVKACCDEAEKFLASEVVSQVDHMKLLQRESALQDAHAALLKRQDETEAVYASCKGDYILKIAGRSGNIDLEGILTRASALLAESNQSVYWSFDAVIKRELERAPVLLRQSNALLNEAQEELAVLVKFRNPQLPVQAPLPKAGTQASWHSDGPCTVH